MPVSLAQFNPVAVERPAEVVFVQIRDLILNGAIPAGESLPSERQLADRFGLNRIHVREALLRLEFYGLVKTRRNVGTVVTGAGIRAIDGLFADVLALRGDDLTALIETRWVIEVEVARLAATRATDEDLAELKAAHHEFSLEVAAGSSGIEKDLAFHLRVADASRNPVLRSLLGLLAPDVMKLAVEDRTCVGGRAEQSLAEHAAVLDALLARDPAAAARAMTAHFQRGAPIHSSRRGKSAPEQPARSSVRSVKGTRSK
jgi:GntR family transcriptional regulator, transcriptional repressor for pyruvate dehydrogenase complex